MGSPLRVSGLSALALMALAAAACGGSVVKDDEDGGAGGGGGADAVTSSGGVGGSGAGTSTGASGTTGPAGSTGTGAAGCGAHDDCPGGLCDFARGTCIDACGDDGTCGPGSVCDACATSSCGPCADCVPGCVVAPPHTCDDHDDCGGEEVCVYGLGGCYLSCGEGIDCGAGFVCDDCATASCPGCRDCRAACVPG